MTFPRTEGQPPFIITITTLEDQPKNPLKEIMSRLISIWTRPEIPFGFGLSYTDFKYSNFNLSSDNLKGSQTLTINVNVANTGNFDGEEVVQLTFVTYLEK
jgi:beta-glucosidase